MISFLLGSVLAAPQFQAADSSHARLADRAWRAGIECAGWEPIHHPVVPILVREISGGFAGRAHITPGGLGLIELRDADARPRTVFHEVAHAWVHGGPSALTEGRTNLLADCMVLQSAPEENLSIYRDDGRWLAEMEPLRSWTNEENADEQTRSDGYTAATRYAYVLAEFIPRAELWPRVQLKSWTELERLLEGRGPEIELMLGLLDEDVSRQRMALTDLDGDGLFTIIEEAWGLDPLTRDTDDDGWEDGLDSTLIPQRARLLDNDGKTHCSGVEYPHGTDAQWTLGTIRGVRTDLSPVAETDDGSLLRVPRELSTVPGAVWVALFTDEATLSLRCIEDTYVLIHAVDDDFIEVARDLRNAIEPHGSGDWRLEIRLGGPETRFAHQLIVLSSADVNTSLLGGTAGLKRLYQVYWLDPSEREQAVRETLAEIVASVPTQEERDRITKERTARAESHRLAREHDAAKQKKRAEAAGVRRKPGARDQLARTEAKHVGQMEQDAEEAKKRALLRAEWEQWLQESAEQRRKTAASGVRRQLHTPALANPAWSEDFVEEDACVVLAATSTLPANSRCDPQSGVLIVQRWSGTKTATVDLMLAEVVGNPRAPVRIDLGTATTTLDEDAVQIARKEVDWAQRHGRPDVLVALASIMVNYLELGLPLDTAAVNDELAIEVGYDVREVKLD